MIAEELKMWKHKVLRGREKSIKLQKYADGK